MVTEENTPTGTPDNIPIAVVDDHTLVRKGIVELIHTGGGYKVVIEAGNGQELIQALAGHNGPPIKLAVVDLKMPVMDGFETLAWLRKNAPDIRAIALTIESSEEAVVKAMRNGARGYLLKDIDPAELKEALDHLMTRGFYHTDLVHLSLMSGSEKPENEEAMRKRILAQITPRELEVIRLVCSEEEHTYERIAEIMGIHRNTVDNYRTSLFDKLKIKSKTGLVLFALRHGLV